MSEQETAELDNVTDDAQAGEEQQIEAPDYSDMDQDKLMEMLTKRDEELAKANDKYANQRSMDDRRSNEMAQRMAKLEGKLEATTARQSAPPPADPNELLKEMKDAIEEDPTKMADYFVKLATEIQSTRAEERQSIESRFNQRLNEQSSDYKANKEFVDRAVKGGMDFKDAVEFAAEVRKNEVSHPGTPKAPGVVEAGRASSAKKDTPRIEISAQDMRIFQAAGLSDKEIQEALKEAAKDMVTA